MSTDPSLLRVITRAPQQPTPQQLSGLRRRMVQDFVLCRVPQLDREARMSGNLLAPTMYEVTGGDDDKLFIGEVIDVGPGVTIGGQHEAMCVQPGELLLCNLSNMSYRFQERGAKVYQVRNGVIAGVLDGKDFSVRPVQDFILVKANEGRALAHSSLGPIWLPTAGFETDDQREAKKQGRSVASAIVAEYGEVVSQGPGRWREGQWHAPPCKPGDLLLYDASYGSLPITIKGEAYTLVPSHQVCMVADES
jgi:co-chaperonin GroES (HSP10)